MNRLRKHPLILFVITLTLPLGVALLYYDFYDDNDLVCRQQIAIADDENVLSILRNYLKVLVAVDQYSQSLIMIVSVNPYFSSDVIPTLPSQGYSILRC